MDNVPRLVAVGGPEEGRAFVLDPAGAILGRHPECPIAVSWDAGVSRHHARLTCRAGLFWLEDLGSKRGTFVSLPGGAERQLVPQQPVLLLDGMIVRLGEHARFRMDGGVASSDEAARQVLSNLQDSIRQLCAGMAHLPAPERQRQLARLEEILRRLEAAASEGELLHLAAEGVPTLEGTAEPGDLAPGSPAAALPPLPNHLPDPGDPARLRTLHNVFVANLRACFPDEDADQGDDRG
ncbi:MAG: FHA domain-containing protein [Anaerolineae bacterium]|nr:FHA domain-containing protein [Anaerolineae bacterium]